MCGRCRMPFKSDRGLAKHRTSMCRSSSDDDGGGSSSGEEATTRTTMWGTALTRRAFWRGAAMRQRRVTAARYAEPAQSTLTDLCSEQQTGRNSGDRPDEPAADCPMASSDDDSADQAGRERGKQVRLGEEAANLTRCHCSLSLSLSLSLSATLSLSLSLSGTLALSRSAQLIAARAG